MTSHDTEARFRLLREGSHDICVLIPFSREWCIERFFAALAASDVPFGRCEAIVYIDGSDDLHAKVIEHVLSLPFAAVCSLTTNQSVPDEYARGGARRPKHALLRSITAGLIADGLVLGLEDDTLIPPDTFARLVALMAAGYDIATGFEVGRWGTNRCPGLWRLDDHRLRTAVPKDAGIERVDACGLYCFLTTAETYRSAAWDMWDDSLGHDVSVTGAMTAVIGVDWELRCVHMTADKGDLTCDMATVLSRRRKPHTPRTPLGLVTRPIQTEDVSAWLGAHLPSRPTGRVSVAASSSVTSTDAPSSQTATVVGRRRRTRITSETPTTTETTTSPQSADGTTVGSQARRRTRRAVG